jgi:hypothetical protein
MHTTRVARSLFTCATLFITCLGGCTWINYEDIQQGNLKGRVYVEWVGEDAFAYRKTSNPLSFQPSFMNTPIVPEDMFTTGGSVPRLFWSIPGLSPWGLGPAYIIHDWIFEVHRCNGRAPPEVAQITFEQSALILAEVGKGLIEAGLIKHDMLEPIVWAVRTNYARGLWDRLGTPDECRIPSKALRTAPAARVVDFVIPTTRRR